MIALAIIIGSIIVAQAIKKKNFSKPYTVTPTSSTTQAEIIKKEEVVDEFLKKI